MTEGPAPLADGMPTFGLGTWDNRDPERCARSVETAVELGYRHVDTARAYGNERHVGEGLARAEDEDIDVFVATKVWHDALGYDDLLASAEASREALGVGTIDLLYVHWPANTYDPEETFAALADLHDDEVIERVGVSNFTPGLLEEALAHADAPIFANQVECHPLLPQDELRAACADHGVHVVGYAPLGRGRIFDVPQIRAVADRHEATPAQVCLAWLGERDVTPIPKASTEAHLRENLASLELALDVDDLARLDGIERRRRFVDPAFAPW